MSNPAGGRHTWSLVVAAVVIVVTVGVVVLFGIIPYPPITALAAQPDPPVTSQLAYVDHGGPEGSCLHVVDGTGEDRQVGCSTAYDGQLRWVAEDRLAVRSFRFDDRDADVIDVTTGAVVDSRPVDDLTDPHRLESRNEAGDRVTAGGGEGTVWIEVVDDDGITDRVMELQGPSRYQLWDVGWTGDGRWVVAQDSIGRLLVVDAEGAQAPRVWAEDVGTFAVR